MRHLITTLAAAGMLLFSMDAAAELSDSGRQDQLFDRLRADLSNANATAMPLTGDFSRIDNARVEVSILQNSVDRHDYDLRQFDRAIRAVQEVVNQNTTLSPRTMDALSDDVAGLHALEKRGSD